MPAHKKPTNIKKLHGTYREDRANPYEPRPIALQIIPEPPFELTGHALNEWRRVTDELFLLKMLHNADLSMIAVYCNEIGNYIESSILARQERLLSLQSESGTIKSINASPHFQIAHKSLEYALKIAAEFGFTPASRTRINAPDQVLEDDPLEALKKKYATKPYQAQK